MVDCVLGCFPFAPQAQEHYVFEKKKKKTGTVRVETITALTYFKSHNTQKDVKDCENLQRKSS